MTTKDVIGPRPEIAKGDRVAVYEQGIDPWLGTVQAVKPSSVSGWWIDVERDADFTWSVCLGTTRVEVMAPAAEEVA